MAYPRCEPASRALYSILFFGVFRNGIHESVPTAIRAAFSHTGAFSTDGVVPATRLSLGTRSHTLGAPLSAHPRRPLPQHAPRQSPAAPPPVPLPRIPCAAHCTSFTRPCWSIVDDMRPARLGSRYTGATPYDVHSATPPRRHPSASPRQQLHATPPSLATHAAHAAPIAAPRPTPLFSSVPPPPHLSRSTAPLASAACATAMAAPLRQRLIYRLLAHQGRFQHAGLSCPRTRISNTTQAAPDVRSRAPSRAPSPRATTVSGVTPLSAKPAPVRHPKCYVKHYRRAQQVRRLPCLHHLPARRPVSSATWRTTHRSAQHMGQPLPIARTARRHRLERRHRLQRLTALRSEPAPVRHLKCYVAHHQRAQQVRRTFPNPYASVIASSRAKGVSGVSPPSARSQLLSSIRSATWRTTGVRRAFPAPYAGVITSSSAATASSASSPSARSALLSGT
ncbi:hypothetical protein C8R44DRAFT_877033 [Mycena epipterygia]|nr:hypothetical protein C8R44DRAFT_877033 [Mycena epipterygia]